MIPNSDYFISTFELHETALSRHSAGASRAPPQLIRLHTPGVLAAEPPNKAGRCPACPEEEDSVK